MCNGFKGARWCSIPPSVMARNSVSWSDDTFFGLFGVPRRCRNRHHEGSFYCYMGTQFVEYFVLCGHEFGCRRFETVWLPPSRRRQVSEQKASSGWEVMVFSFGSRGKEYPCMMEFPVWSVNGLPYHVLFDEVDAFDLVVEEGIVEVWIRVGGRSCVSDIERRYIVVIVGNIFTSRMDYSHYVCKVIFFDRFVFDVEGEFC